MTLFDLLDPIYDPTPTDDAPDDAPGASWEPVDYTGGEGGGE